MDYVLLLVSLAILIFCAELLVRGAVGVATKFHISSLVIGMTVVSFGTSAPELIVSIQGALSGHSDVSVGAAVGSNIANITLILGISALIFPIIVTKSSLYRDWPMMMLASVLFYVFALDNVLVWEEGLSMFLILALYIFWIINKSRKKGLQEISIEDVDEVVGKVKNTPLWRNLLLVVLGCAGLVFGADILLDSVINIATSHGVSEKMLSLTVVALGTSFPELITSAVASFKKESDLSVGNLIGSNIFNLLGILGLTALIDDVGVSPSMLHFDTYCMLFVSLLIFPLMYFSSRLGRTKGAFLALLYISYIFYTVHKEIEGGIYIF